MSSWLQPLAGQAARRTLGHRDPAVELAGGFIAGGVVAWQRYWDGMWSDGSVTYTPNVPDRWVWTAAISWD